MLLHTDSMTRHVGSLQFSEIVCSANLRDQFAKVCDFCLKLTDTGLKYHYSLEKHASQILFTDKALPTIRFRGQIWGKKDRLNVQKLAYFESVKTRV